MVHGDLNKWTLVSVDFTNWLPDDTGMYAVIHPEIDQVRVDMLDAKDIPVRSYQGQARDVYKQIARDFPLSREHAAYIGFELARAELLGAEYHQD